MTPTYEELARPLPLISPKRWYYGAVHRIMKLASPLSKGLSIGFEHGFDSGVMLEHVYQNIPTGTGPLGKLIDKVYLNSPGWTGIRARGELVKDALRAALYQHAPAQGGTLRLLDVACGGGRYDLEVLREFQDKRPDVKIEATLRDYAQVNVDSAQALGQKLGVRGVTYQRADAFSDADLAQATESGLIDIAIVSGLHEILANDDLIHQHFKQLSGVLKPNGTLIYTLQPTHPQVEFIARTLPSNTGDLWVMRLRSAELIESWASEGGFKSGARWMEPQGIFGVVLANKS
ncbi:methyltransferase domain-containing protein [Deinococcus psychrotolerans]|uniref:Methyltransferase domain-containing protein n=1 Tax=Deinococcus psychrotolerans TaxID=2489213 RepID=A0A3G8YCL8_9DEIO|nr:class I SAM-dependent methyltransferase family protein [Deinococcus psychrotolerans]AZI42735.1 methyltransferase domain-containing protein [Deinococcus psychrotolerans]